MTHEVALVIVNQMQTQLARLVRAIVAATADGTLRPEEGINLGLQGMTLASVVAALVQGIEAQTRHDVLTVLERGTFVYTE